MLPLLPQVGRFADPSPLPFEDRRTIRRGAPEALRVEPASPGWPPLRLSPAPPPQPPRDGAGPGWLGRLWRGATVRAGSQGGPVSAPSR